MFSDRLNTAMRIAGASAADIARYMDCDRSNVCRFMKGHRVPRRGGGAAQRLTGAIYAAADYSGNTDALRGLIGSGGSSAEDIRSGLIQWLYQDEAQTSEPISSSVNSMPYLSFGHRLNAVMKLTGTSNISLGKQLSIDPSYISRFRNGFRSPLSNRRIADGMAEALMDRIYEKGLVCELIAIMKGNGELPTDRELLYPVFYRWLYGIETDYIPVIENLIQFIGGYTAPENSPQETRSPSEHVSDSKVYFGVDGLRDAVLRFLTYVCENVPSDIYLYSDQNMDWLTSSHDYSRKWADLMVRCIKNGTHLHIIHNIERGLDEMNGAIQSWLPLYPAGNIHSYYCKRKKDERFTTTLFICPGIAAIAGNCVKGSENECGLYRYDTDAELISAHMSSFKALLSESGELVRAFPTTQLEKTSMTTEAGITVLTSRLSLATFPEELLREMLDRSGADDSRKQDIYEMWNRQHSYYSHIVKKEFIHECIPLEYGKLPCADLPGITLRYTAEEYAAHLRHIEQFSMQFPGYRLYPLPEPIFENIRVRIAKDEIVISRLKEPHTTFVFEHPYMCGSFISYGKKLKEMFYRDKQSVNELLENIIKSVDT